MAVTLTTVFCFVNKRWLKIAPKALYEVACMAAESDPKERWDIHKALVKVFKEKIEPLPREYRIDMRRKGVINVNKRTT